MTSLCLYTHTYTYSHTRRLGMLIFECFTRKQPYHNIRNVQQLLEAVMAGKCANHRYVGKVLEALMADKSFVAGWYDRCVT